MDTKLCRVCGKLSENYVHIFKTEGLKNKIETCLPIIVSPHCLLPDTICSECLENVDNFYSFIKNCLQNIIVLEAQYDIMDSCLKTKRKHEKGCLTDFTQFLRYDKNIQTDEDFSDFYLHKPAIDELGIEKLATALKNAENILNGRQLESSTSSNCTNSKRNSSCILVDYDMETSDSECENDNSVGKVMLIPKMARNKLKVRENFVCDRKKYFDDPENHLITEIVQRKDLKRQSDTVLPHRTKIFKMDICGSRRKSRQPKKVEYLDKDATNIPSLTFNNLEKIYQEMEKNDDSKEEGNKTTMEKQGADSLLQLCLLCDVQFSGATALATHVYETHGIDMAQVISSEPVLERKKKIPNLLKITDLKTKEGSKEQQSSEERLMPESTFICSICPTVLTSRLDLFAHLKTNHAKQAALMCGLCLHLADSYPNLTVHLSTCKQSHGISSKYMCKICCYHEDNSKAMENHVAVHDFILAFCKKQSKMFDPCDYVELNPASDASGKSLACTECNRGGFRTFKEFSTHRRSEHQIFHCDLCNKFYGRNSHLWKHVNRLHKGHPSITCQLCYKTSASKYHLAQHFNKIHSAKPFKQKQQNEEDMVESFMMQKFQGFDFQSVRQSFMRQELLEQERTKFARSNGSEEDNSEGEEIAFYAKECEQFNIKHEVKSEPFTYEMECSDLELYANEQDEYEEQPKTSLEMKEPKEHHSVSPPKEIDASSDLYTNIITNYTPPQNEGEYKCPKCFKGFHKKTLLKKHKKNCRPRLQKDLLTRCKTCSRIFKDRQSLTKHLINYHSEYACEICGQKVQSKCEIVSHIRFSHPRCHLFCHCGNILRSQLDLAEHKRDHRNSFVCQFCGDMLPTKIKLKMHILSLHRKILSLSCGICLKLFETQHILRDHVRLVHGDELSPLTSCTVCGKNYGSKWKTYDHLNKSHGRIFKACKACLDVFDTEEGLQVHFDAAHASAATPLPLNKANSPHVASTALSNKAESDENDKNSSSELSSETFVYEKVEANLTEDEEVLPTAPLQPPPPPTPQQKTMQMSDVLTQESKISLLEKRLLGSKKWGEGECHASFTTCGNWTLDKGIVPNKAKNAQNLVGISKKSKPDNADISASTKQPKNDKKQLSAIQKKDPEMMMMIMAESSEPNGTQNPLQNSSKRTVYVNSNDPSLCEICLKTWPAKKHLWQHYIRCHKRVAATVCGICLKTNDNYRMLQMHLQENHPTLLHGQGFGSNFICRICGRYHNASSKLKLHMAIHENFDRSILDGFNSQSEEKKTKPNENNGYLGEERFYMHAGDDNHDLSEGINYESLIEQVECSSESDSDSGKDAEKYENAETTEEDDDNDEEETDNDSVISISEENSLESQMLKNMLKEKFAANVTTNNVRNKSSHRNRPNDNSSNGSLPVDQIKVEEYSSSESEEEDDSSDSVQTGSDTEVTMEQIKSSSDENSRLSQLSESFGGDYGKSNVELENSSMFVRQPEELDSAIRSISYENVSADVRQRIDDEMNNCEMQTPPTLNQHEIQSAVDSIL